MAAFCECCGTEITLEVEACPACGMPRHGMMKSPNSLGSADDSLQGFGSEIDSRPGGLTQGPGRGSRP